MSNSKEKARLPKEVRPVEEPLVTVCGVEDIRCKSPTTLNSTERSNMTTMEAREVPPPGMECKSTLSGESNRLSSFPMLLTLLELAQPAHAHGASSSSGNAHGASNSEDESWQIQDGQKHVIQNYLLPGDTGNAPTPPGLVQIGSQSVVNAEHGSMHQPREVLADRGKAPMGITSQTAGLTPPSPNEGCDLTTTPTQSQHEAHKTDDPSKAPKGSLIHTLYRQLLDAGEEGVTLPELLKSFKKLATWQSFASDWEQEVKFHVENNPHVREVRKYSLRSKEQPSLQQNPKPSSPIMCMRPTIAPDTTAELELSLGTTQQRDIEHLAPPPRATKQVTAGDLEVSLLTTLGCNTEAPLPPTLPQWFSLNHSKDLSIRRNVCQAETETIQTQSTAKLEKIPIEHTELHKQMTAWIAAWVADPSSSQPPTRMQVPKWSTKRKVLSDGTEQPNWLHVPIHAGLQKQQAEALAKQEKIDAAKRARHEADESQIVASFDIKGCQDLPTSQMHSTEVPLVVAEQPVESNPDDTAKGHPNGDSISNINPDDSDVSEKLEL